MKNLKTIAVYLVLISTLPSCGPSISAQIQKTYPPIVYDATVVVYQMNDEIPKSAEVIGHVSVGEGGFTTRCSLYDVVTEAKLEARKCGGNAIKITEHKTPNAWSTCHRIEADILRTKN